MRSLKASEPEEMGGLAPLLHQGKEENLGPSLDVNSVRLMMASLNYRAFVLSLQTELNIKWDLSFSSPVREGEREI